MDGAMAPTPTVSGAVTLSYDSQSGWRPFWLLFTHVAFVPVIVRLAREASRGGSGQERSLLPLLHHVFVVLSSVLWHSCNSLDLCPLGEEVHHQMLDHFTATTTIPILLVYGLPNLLAYHRHILTTCAWLLHAMQFVSDPTNFSSARADIYVYGAIYAGAHLQHYAHKPRVSAAAAAAAAVAAASASITLRCSRSTQAGGGAGSGGWERFLAEVDVAEVGCAFRVLVALLHGPQDAEVERDDNARCACGLVLWHPYGAGDWRGATLRVARVWWRRVLPLCLGGGWSGILACSRRWRWRWRRGVGGGGGGGGGDEGI
jgi:hypothetical protein